MSFISGKVTSKDGTTIAYSRRGKGPAVILVDGALCSRALGPMAKLAEALAPSFTVFDYDRRGRNESGDTAPYSIEREIEDLGALIEVAGGSAFVFGASSGAMLALRAAAVLPGVKKLAMYEAPITIAGSPEPVPPDRVAEIVALVNEGRLSEATKTFMKMVGAPGFAIFMTRLMPGIWSKLTAAAATLPHDFAALGDTGPGKPLPADVTAALAGVKVPTLVGVGGKSPAWMKFTAETLAGRIAGAELETLPGQDHMVKEKAQAPVLAKFFGR